MVRLRIGHTTDSIIETPIEGSVRSGIEVTVVAGSGKVIPSVPDCHP